MKKLWGKLAVASSILLLLTSLQPLAASAVEPSGDTCTITGTSGNDTINGTSGDDVICGLGGNDTINGGLGNDIIVGGDGDDTINGQLGNDTIYGDAGSDQIYGASGDDSLFGGLGEDDLFGEAGLDSLNGDEDIDGLNGGADKDTLVGGAGDDICVDFSADTYTRNDCRVDRTAPRISNLVLDNGSSSVDSSNGDAYLSFSFDMVDHGAGVQYVMIGFQPIAKANRPVNSAVAVTVGTSFCRSAYHCLVSGTPQRGHYHASVQLPGKLAQGSIVISYIMTIDSLYNQKTYSRAQILAGGLDMPFTQTGTPDLSAPVISNFAFVGDDHNADAESEYLFARATFTDAHNLQTFILNFDTPEASHFGFQAVFDSNSFQPCSEAHLAYEPCLVSGTQSSGVLEFPIHMNVDSSNLRYFFKPQRIVPLSYEIRDNMGNSKITRFTSADASALTIFKSYKNTLPADDRDNKAPVLKKLSVSTTVVTNLETAATFTVTARFTDKGVGINRYSRGDVNLAIVPAEGTGLFCSQVGNATGSPVDATFTFSCTIPKFAYVGKWSFDLDAMDMSQRRNQTSLVAADLASKRLPSFVTNQ